MVWVGHFVHRATPGDLPQFLEDLKLTIREPGNSWDIMGSQKNCNMADGKAIEEIDGSILEGGGQILRNAITFGCLLGRSVRVFNIRAGRSNPGLRPQHATGLHLVQNICKGTLDGTSTGSSSITFQPGRVTAGTFSADTKTAGSTSLLLQVSLPCLLYASSESTMKLKGGTNAEMAPQIDYMTQVFQPVAEKFGLNFEVDILKRGYYPKGGGEVHVKVQPITQLRAVNMLDPGSLIKIKGQAFVAGALPIKVAQRMAQEATRLLRKNYRDIPTNIEAIKEQGNKAVGTGSGIWIIAETSTGCKLAGSAIGKKGLPSETVASNAVEELIDNLRNNCCVDQHLQDQVVILMALADGRSSFKTGPITLHTQTAIHIAEKLTNVKFNVKPFPEEESAMKTFIIECNGIGLKNKYL